MKGANLVVAISLVGGVDLRLSYILNYLIIIKIVIILFLFPEFSFLYNPYNGVLMFLKIYLNLNY